MATGMLSVSDTGMMYEMNIASLQEMGKVRAALKKTGQLRRSKNIDFEAFAQQQADTVVDDTMDETFANTIIEDVQMSGNVITVEDFDTE